MTELDLWHIIYIVTFPVSIMALIFTFIVYSFMPAERRVLSMKEVFETTWNLPRYL